MKINNLRHVAYFAFFLCLITLCADILTPYAHAGAYKWKKENGTVVFSDQPGHAGKKTKKIEKVIGLNSESDHEDVVDDEENLLYKTKVESNSSGNGVDMIEPINIEYSVAGFAKVVAKIKNNLDYPVDGLRLDILFFHKSRRRSNQYQIPFKDGKQGTKPDMLMPGESGSFDFETGLKPSIIAGYRFRLVWNQFDKIEPKDPEKLPDNVTRITVPAKDSDLPAPEKMEPK